jgi:Uma2 family endonuclease
LLDQYGANRTLTDAAQSSTDHRSIEVLSESTERHDRGLKLRHYRSIESLQEYLLVSQTECRVERYARQPSGEWAYSDVTDPNAALELSSIACRLLLARVYDRIDLPG